jgi:hypothetical protein
VAPSSRRRPRPPARGSCWPLQCSVVIPWLGWPVTTQTGMRTGPPVAPCVAELIIPCRPDAAPDAEEDHRAARGCRCGLKRSASAGHVSDVSTSQGHEAPSLYPPRPDPDVRFDELYGSAGPSVLGYALSRCVRREDALDVTAETFLVAWRRRAEMPADPDEARALPFGVARLCLANLPRGDRRSQGLGQRLVDAAQVAALPDPGRRRPRPDPGAARSRLHRARLRLRALAATRHRRMSLMSVIDELRGQHAGRVSADTGDRTRTGVR